MVFLRRKKIKGQMSPVKGKEVASNNIPLFTGEGNQEVMVAEVGKQRSVPNQTEILPKKTSCYDKPYVSQSVEMSQESPHPYTILQRLRGDDRRDNNSRKDGAELRKTNLKLGHHGMPEKMAREIIP